MFKTFDGKLIRGDETRAKQGRWSLLKGGIVAKFSSPVEILLEVKYIILLVLSSALWYDFSVKDCILWKEWIHVIVFINAEQKFRCGDMG